MYYLEVYVHLPGIGWSGIDSYKLGASRHSALTNPQIERAVESVSSRYPFAQYFAISFKP